MVITPIRARATKPLTKFSIGESFGKTLVELVVPWFDAFNSAKYCLLLDKIVKYKPAPTEVRRVDGRTPLHRSLNRSSLSISFITVGLYLRLSLCCCCNLVFNKSRGCNVKADTSPAAAPAMRWMLVVGFFFIFSFSVAGSRDEDVLSNVKGGDMNRT